MKTIYVLMALLAGLLMPLQVGVNATLRRFVGEPVWAALGSFAVGTAALLVLGLALRLPAPAWERAQQAPLWAWTGGFLGAFFVGASLVAGPRLGAAALAALVIAAQLIASLALDHFGLVGFRAQPVDGAKLLGAVLLVAGAVLIVR